MHICALVLPTVPLSLSPSTGDLVSNWAAFVGWPSPIKDAHFTYHLSLWLAGSHPFGPATPLLHFRSNANYVGPAARRSASARFTLVCYPCLLSLFVLNAIYPVGFSVKLIFYFMFIVELVVYGGGFSARFKLSLSSE